MWLKNLRGQFGHEIFPKKRYLKELYLQESMSKNISIKKFCIFNFDMCLIPDEIFLGSLSKY